MGATITRHADRIAVQIEGSLGYGIWQTLRDARDAAQASELPLCLDVAACDHADLGGMGAVMIAQERLADVALSGCSSRFAAYFEAFGICAHCTTQTVPATCSRSTARSGETSAGRRAAHFGGRASPSPSPE